MNGYALWLLTRRNLKIFLKDKANVFFSLLAPLIVLVLYVLFLGRIQEDGLLAALEEMGVAGGEATGAFQGLVYVAPGAQRTDAQQTSRNVELSTGARIVAKPQLEIYADDVKCTHGATVGQMDDEAILYMRQRGLSEQQARRLQMEGFVAAIAAHCAVEPLCEELYRRIVAKLERM